MSEPLLTIELVPQTSWFTNLRSELSGAEWDKIRRKCYRDAGHVCEVCGGVGPAHPVECHEIWHYDDSAKVQKLSGVVALCPACHEVKHIGLANMKGNLGRALAHMARVNGWTVAEAEDAVDAAFDVWRGRSEHKWNIDIKWLESLEAEGHE